MKKMEKVIFIEVGR